MKLRLGQQNMLEKFLSRNGSRRQWLVSLILFTTGFFGLAFLFRGFVPLLVPPPSGLKPNKKRIGDGEDGVADNKDDREVDSAAAEEEKKAARYEELGRTAIEAFKSERYQDAADGFTAALALGESLQNVNAQQKTLILNRSACYEKLRMFEEALRDCATINAQDPSNTKANRRRERLVELMIKDGKFVEALTELMVPFILEMDSYKHQLMLAGGNQDAMASIPIPSPPPNMDEVTKKAAKQVADAIEGASRQRTFGLPGTFSIKSVLGQLPSYNAVVSNKERRDVSEITKDVDGATTAVENIGYLYERALVHIAEQRFKRADEDLVEALALWENLSESEAKVALGSEVKTAEFLSWAATFLHLKHDLEASKKLLEKSWELNEDVETCVKLGVLHLDSQNYGESESYFSDAVARGPDLSFVYYWKSQFSLHSTQITTEKGPEKAENDLNLCLQHDEANVTAMLRLINLKMQAGNQEEADALMEKARRLAPRSSEVMAANTEFLLMKNELDEAGREIEKAIRLDPTNPMAYINKALICCQTGDVATAKEVLQELLAMDPTYCPAYPFLFNIEIRLVSDYDDVHTAFELLDQGIKMSRVRDDLEESVTLKVLSEAKFGAGKRLGWTAMRIAQL